MRLWVPFLSVALLGGCRSDGDLKPRPASSATPSVATSTPGSTTVPDVTPLPGAPTIAEVTGWWVVADGQPPNDDPGSKPGAAYWIGADAVRLIVGDTVDRRVVSKSSAHGDELELSLEGSALLLTRRPGGIALRSSDDEPRIALRRATDAEVRVFEKSDAKAIAMLGRACEKALECCSVAVAHKLGNEDDCKPLMGPPEMSMCIRAIALFKRKAAAAHLVLPECLPDK